MDKELREKLEAETPPLSIIQQRQDGTVIAGTVEQAAEYNKQLSEALSKEASGALGKIVSISIRLTPRWNSRNEVQGRYYDGYKFKKRRKLGNKARNIRGLHKLKPVNVTFSIVDLSSVVVRPLEPIVFVSASQGPTSPPLNIYGKGDYKEMPELANIRSCQCGHTTDINICMTGITPEICPLCNTAMKLPPQGTDGYKAPVEDYVSNAAPLQLRRASGYWACSCSQMTSLTIPPGFTLAEYECPHCHTKMKEL